MLQLSYPRVRQIWSFRGTPTLFHHCLEGSRLDPSIQYNRVGSKDLGVPRYEQKHYLALTLDGDKVIHVHV